MLEQIQLDAIDEAVRRFPYRLKRWRDMGGVAPDVLVIAFDMLAEYHRIIAEKRKVLRPGNPPGSTRPAH